MSQNLPSTTTPEFGGAVSVSQGLPNSPVQEFETASNMLWLLLPDLIAGISSVIIPALTLLVCMRDSNRAQKREEISTKPLLSLMEKTVSGKEKGISEMHFELYNVGVGPSIIKRYAIFFDNKEIVVNTHKAKDEIKSQMEHGIPGLLNYGVGYQTSVAAGECRKLLYAEIIGPEANAQAFAKRFGFKIDYQSIYEDKTFVCASRNSSGYPKDKSPTHEVQKG